MKIRGILISTTNGEPRVVEIEDTLDEYYKILNCDTIDIIGRKIGNENYCIVLDDNGLFVEQPVLTGVSYDEHQQLFGNLFICGKSDAEGNLTSLSDADVFSIRGHIWTAKSSDEVNSFVIRFD